MCTQRNAQKTRSRWPTQVIQNVHIIFRESDRIHDFPEVAISQNMEEFNQRTQYAVVTNMEESDLDNEDNMMLTLIYSNN